MASSSYIQLIAKIQAFCDAHLQIQRFDAEFGEQRPNLATDSEKYPYVFLAPTSGVPNYDLNTITVEITCYDIIQKDRDNLNTIVSDCHQILTDLYGYYNQGEDSDILALSATQTPLNNYDLDYVAGWSMSVEFELEGWCNNAIPMTPITPVSGDCEDANYTLKDTAGATLSSGTIASGGSADITAPDGTVNVNKSDATLISAETVVSGGTTNYNVGDSAVSNSDASYSVNVKATEGLSIPDSTLNFNGASQGSIVSVKTVDVDLEDGAGNPVTPDAVSLVGNTLTIDVTTGGGATETSRIIKSGLTTSYRTGDDGDLQRGRATDFLTLASNNPFGNLDRFTDTLGGSTYANSIVLDWSTYDGTEVLAYYIGDSATARNWNTAIDWAVALTTDSKTDWQLANIRELLNICNYASASILNYSPFNKTVALWSSSAVSATQSIYLVPQSTIMNRSNMTNSYRTYATRYYTNAELGI